MRTMIYEQTPIMGLPFKIMKTIWEFPIQLVDEQEIDMPIRATIISVQMQGEQLCLWALVQDNVATEKRTILIRGTGHNATLCNNHIGTIQQGPFVLHVFA